MPRNSAVADNRESLGEVMELDLNGRTALVIGATRMYHQPMPAPKGSDR
jgi:hypothetical protein